MWKFGIASVASLCVLTGGIAAPFVFADAPTTAPAPAGTDKIEGKVMDPNGQPVSGATVMLFAGKTGGKAGHKSADPTAATPGQGSDTPNQPAPGGKQKRTPLQQTTTAADGSFSFVGLADGNYQVSARVKGVGVAHQAVTLNSTSADQSVTLTLAPHMKGNKAKNQ